MNSLKKNRKGTNMNNSGNRENMSNSNSNINNHPSGHNSLRRGKNSPQDKNITSAEGIYDNGRLMHAVTSLIGSIVQVVVKGGYTYEGVLKTFSPDFEVVVEMAIEIDSKVVNGGQNIGGLLHSLINEHEVHSTMIFKLQDIIMLNVLNVDLDYALKASTSGKFTDTEISKHDTNSIKERELVPWDGGTSDNDHCTLEDDTHNNSSSQNGWDADAMFKLNEEKYKVSTTYDSSLKDYTTPLEVKDTEEYKQLQAEAEKIATDIERSSSSKNRTMLEDGDEEERFSSVTRPAPVNNDNFHSNTGRQSNRRKPTNINFNSVGGGRGKSGHSGPLMSSPTSVHQKYQQTQSHHHHHNHHHYYSQPQHTHQYNNYSNKSPSTVSPPTSLPQQKTVTPKEDLPVAKSVSVTNTTSTATNNSNSVSSNNNSSNQVFTRTVEQKEYATAVASGPPVQQAPLPQRSQNENRRTGVTKKREEVINELKNFGNDFKLNSEVKELSLKEQSPKENLPPKQEVKAFCTEHNIQKETPKVSPPPVAIATPPASEKQSPPVEPETITENNDGENVVKKSTLNPNAKEFNPTRSFTPRVSYVSHPVVQTIPHQPAPITQQAQQQPQQQITIQPHQQQHQARIPNSLVAFPPFVGPFQIISPNPYVLTPTFTPNNNTRPNFRNKGPQQYHNQNRHDYSQSSVNVVTATGHPVLTGHPNQITFNHSNQVGAGAPPAYHNVYTRMVSPGVQCVPFDPNLQHYYGVPSMLIPQTALNNGTQVSAPSTPQSGQPSTPIHTGPPHTPPVHHTGGSSQPQQQLTQTIMYTVPTTVATQHGGQTQMTSQTSNCNYIGQLPPLLHIGPVHQNMSHSSSATQHGSTQAPLISAVPGTIIPTSATVVASQGAMQTHYAPNPQNRI